MKDSAFVFPVRVYWEDTDAGGVVYYSNYLKFMERGRTEWLRARGVEQPELARRHGVIFVVRRVAIDYLKPAVFNDLLNVTATLSGSSRASLSVTQTIERDRILARADVDIVCVQPASFRPARIPGDVLALIGGGA